MDEQERDAPEQREDARERSLMGEFFLFMKENKAWWITPLLLSLLLLAVLVFFSSASVSPFIYRPD